MRIPGGKGGVMMAILAAWTGLCALVVVLYYVGASASLTEYDRLVAARGASVGLVDPLVEDVALVAGLVGCMWLPVAVALLIASIALWSRRR